MHHLFLQNAIKSPEVKKKIQHVTWPWPIVMYLELMLWMENLPAPPKCHCPMVVLSTVCVIPPITELLECQGLLSNFRSEGLNGSRRCPEEPLRGQTPVSCSATLSASTGKEQRPTWSPTHIENFHWTKTSNMALISQPQMKQYLPSYLFWRSFSERKLVRVWNCHFFLTMFFQNSLIEHVCVCQRKLLFLVRRHLWIFQYCVVIRGNKTEIWGMTIASLFLKCIYLKFRVSFTVTVFALDVYHVHRNSIVTIVSRRSVSVTNLINTVHQHKNWICSFIAQHIASPMTFTLHLLCAFICISFYVVLT